MNVKVTPLPKSTYQLDVVIPSQEVKREIELVTDLFSQNLDVPGFRRGKAPRAIVREKVGLEKIKREALQSLLEKNFATIIKEANLSPISSPGVKVAEIEEENDLEVSITVATMPEVAIKDYQKIKIKKPSPKRIEDKQVKEQVKALFESWTKQGQSDTQSQPVVYQADGQVALKSDPQDLARPNDEFAQKIGAKDITDLEDKIRQELEAQERTRVEKEFEDSVLEELVKRTKVQIPDALVNEELNRMMTRLHSQISGMGGSFEDFLKTQGKTPEQLRASWQEVALKNVTLELALAKIAQEEHVQVSSDEVQAQLKGHDHAGHTSEEKHQEEAYYEHVLRQSKTFELIKNQAKK